MCQRELHRNARLLKEERASVTAHAALLTTPGVAPPRRKPRLGGECSRTRHLPVSLHFSLGRSETFSVKTILPSNELVTMFMIAYSHSFVPFAPSTSSIRSRYPTITFYRIGLFGEYEERRLINSLSSKDSSPLSTVQ